MDLSNLDNIEIIHSFNESDENKNSDKKKKNKTDFIKKSMGAFSHELLSEDLSNRWAQIASDVFGDGGE